MLAFKEQTKKEQHKEHLIKQLYFVAFTIKIMECFRLFFFIFHLFNASSSRLTTNNITMFLKFGSFSIKTKFLSILYENEIETESSVGHLFIQQT